MPINCTVTELNALMTVVTKPLTTLSNTHKESLLLVCCHELDRKHWNFSKGKITSNEADKTASNLTQDPSAYSAWFGFSSRSSGLGIFSGRLTFSPPDS